ncbi:MAG: B3/4 domain-containing protein [Actinomycetota bacterium]
MTFFEYHADILEHFPDVRGGVIHATGLANGASPAALVDAYQQEQAAVKERLGGTLLSEVPSLAAWRRVFSAFGVKPTQYRSAAESLLRRLTKKGDIPSINTLVDIANLVSIRYGLPVAVFDQSQVSGGTTVRFADGSERFTDLGSNEVSHPETGEVIFVDEENLVSARRWCWRQSSQSAAGPATVEALITVEGHHKGAEEDVGRATRDLVDLLVVHQPGPAVSQSVLSSARPRFDSSS